MEKYMEFVEKDYITSPAYIIDASDEHAVSLCKKLTEGDVRQGALIMVTPEEFEAFGKSFRVLCNFSPKR